MKFISLTHTFVFVLCFACGDAFSASLSAASVTLCNNGYAATNATTCTSYDTGLCPSGSYELPANNQTAVSLQDNACRVATYSLTTVDDVVTASYHGVLSGSEITLCNNGYAATNASTCTSYARGVCQSGNYELQSNTVSVVATTQNGLCNVATYSRAVVDDVVSAEYHGVLSGSQITLCDNGYAATNATTCTSYTTGYCPNNYYSMAGNPSTFTNYTTSCPNNYSQFIAEGPCSYTPSTTYCMDVCGNGQYTTSLGTCASLCSLGATTLRTSTGLLFPMWSSSQATPSINLGIGNGVCYVNLESGTTNDSGLMFDWGGTTYHAVQ